MAHGARFSSLGSAKIQNKGKQLSINSDLLIHDILPVEYISKIFERVTKCFWNASVFKYYFQEIKQLCETQEEETEVIISRSF